MQNDIWTSKSAPNPSVFYTSHFHMCFAPQRRALSRHVNFQKWSDIEVFCTFWLRNFETCFAPQLSPLFQHLSFQKMCFVHFDLEMCFAPQRRAICIDGSAPAALATLLFDSWATSYWKNIAIHDFYLFAHLHLLSSDSFSSLIFLLLLCSSLTLPAYAFSSVHIVGSLTSKLPPVKHPPHILSFGLNCPLSVCQEILHRGAKYDIAVLTDRIDKCNLAATWLPVGQCAQQFRLHVWPCQGLATPCHFLGWGALKDKIDGGVKDAFWCFHFRDDAFDETHHWLVLLYWSKLVYYEILTYIDRSILSFFE